MSSTEVAFDDAFLASLLGDFLDESTELIQTLNENLLDLDDRFHALAADAVVNIEPERMNEMFRAAHSMKAVSAMLGLDEFQRLTHEMENVFDDVRGNGLVVDLDFVSRTFETVDRLTEMVAALCREDGDAGSCGAVEPSGKEVSCPMAAVGGLFERFARVAMEVAQTCGKEISLACHGEAIQLEKHLIDQLGDPLVHLARNAADHGIETPAERVAAGKSTRGEIVLTALRREGRFYLRIQDDGRGLDPAKILAKAIEKQIIASSAAVKLWDDEILHLIWAPGFSTADRVTDISGRGVGTDIVKSKIEKLGGTVEIESTPGAGVTFTIGLPLPAAVPASTHQECVP